MPVAFAVLHGAHSLQAAEALGEVAGGGEAQDLSDLGEGIVGVGEQKAALLGAPGNKVADGGDIILFAEGVDQVIFVDVGNGRQLVQGQILFKMVVNVAPDRSRMMSNRCWHTW